MVRIFYASRKHDDGNILFPGLFQYTGGHFSHRCLPIGPSFTGKDQVGSLYFLAEVQRVQHQADTRLQLGIQERQETSAHSSGCPGSGNIRNVFAGNRPDNP